MYPKIITHELELPLDRIIDTPEKMVQVLSPLVRDLDHEVIIETHLDENFKLIDIWHVATGGKHRVVGMPIWLELCPCPSVKYIIAAHNHPIGPHCGNTIPCEQPSWQDQATTDTHQNIAPSLDVHLIDHLVIAGDGAWWSIRFGPQSKAQHENYPDHYKVWPPILTQ